MTTLTRFKARSFPIVAFPRLQNVFINPHIFSHNFPCHPSCLDKNNIPTDVGLFCFYSKCEHVFHPFMCITFAALFLLVIHNWLLIFIEGQTAWGERYKKYYDNEKL